MKGSFDQTDRITSEVTVGDFLKDDDSGTESEFGEVVRSSHNTVTVLWDDGTQEQILRDLLDHSAFSIVDDTEVPPPEGFVDLLKQVYPELADSLE